MSKLENVDSQKKIKPAKEVKKPVENRSTGEYVKIKHRPKKSLHPKYGPIKVEFPDGETLEIMSTSNENLRPDVSPASHPAWVGGNTQANLKEKSVAMFTKRYGSLFKQ
tara:strand:- start:585 stop:911 length:327 start_codon:yes stop_codon:yes gene_type:complete